MAAIYRADCYCNDCANVIRAQLQHAGKAPEDPTNESSYDSDNYPKYMPDNEEADTPQHCGMNEKCLNAVELGEGRKCGALLSTRLTIDGVEYVKEAISQDRLHSKVVEYWRNQFANQLT